MSIPRGFKFGPRKSPPPVPIEVREKISRSLTGRKRMKPLSEESRKRLSLSKTGLKQSAETIEKRVSKFRGENHWRYKGGLPKCIDCGKKLSARTYERCRKCNDLSISGSKSKFWKGGYENKLLLNSKYRSLRKKSIGSFTLEEWELLKKQYGNKCPRCNKLEPDIKLTIDHIIPLSKGGSNYIENIQPLCYSCNSSKGNRIAIKY